MSVWRVSRKIWVSRQQALIGLLTCCTPKSVPSASQRRFLVAGPPLDGTMTGYRVAFVVCVAIWASLGLFQATSSLSMSQPRRGCRSKIDNLTGAVLKEIRRALEN
jgi:hypothetical protein